MPFCSETRTIEVTRRPAEGNYIYVQSCLRRPAEKHYICVQSCLQNVFYSQRHGVIQVTCQLNFFVTMAANLRFQLSGPAKPFLTLSSILTCVLPNIVMGVHLGYIYIGAVIIVIQLRHLASIPTPLHNFELSVPELRYSQ